MELKAIETSRITYLTTVYRPAGQLFLPAGNVALMERYHFQRGPTADDLAGDVWKYAQGVWEGIGINELNIYPDGVVVETRAPTDFLSQFLDDLLKWADEVLGLKETRIPPNERHYESHLIVAMSIDPHKACPAMSVVAEALSSKQANYGLRGFNFDLAAFSVATDQTQYAGRRPVQFTLARRVAAPFSAGIWYSTAPLKTSDHIQLLERIEGLLS